MYAYGYDTKLGHVLITASEDAIKRLDIGVNVSDNAVFSETPIIQKAHEQLKEYLDGKRKIFDIPLEPDGTEFQRRVWECLKGIPYGETRTYGQIAAQAGNPKASRAVGSANHKNPLPIFIPCHRVVGANGKLVGYGLGLPMKEFLINLERDFK